MLLKSKEDTTKEQSTVGALAFVWDVGYLTAIPVIIFAFGGRYLDMRYDASPWFLLCGLCISVLLSAYLVYKRMQRFL